MTLEEYENLLKNHDWYYQYSDNHGIWKTGQMEQELILQYQPLLDPDKKIFNKYREVAC